MPSETTLPFSLTTTHEPFVHDCAYAVFQLAYSVCNCSSLSVADFALFQVAGLLGEFSPAGPPPLERLALPEEPSPALPIEPAAPRLGPGLALPDAAPEPPALEVADASPPELLPQAPRNSGKSRPNRIHKRSLIKATTILWRQMPALATPKSHGQRPQCGDERYSVVPRQALRRARPTARFQSASRADSSAAGNKELPLLAALDTMLQVRSCASLGKSCSPG